MRQTKTRNNRESIKVLLLGKANANVPRARERDTYSWRPTERMRAACRCGCAVDGDMRVFTLAVCGACNLVSLFGIIIVTRCPRRGLPWCGVARKIPETCSSAFRYSKTKIPVYFKVYLQAPRCLKMCISSLRTEYIVQSILRSI